MERPTLETWLEVSERIVDKKTKKPKTSENHFDQKSKLLRSEIHKMAAMMAILKIYFELLLNQKAS